MLALLLLAPQELKVTYDPGKLVPVFEMEGFQAAEDDPLMEGKSRAKWEFRRDNPRSYVSLALSPKAQGRPRLVDSAGRPVHQNRTFGVKNPSLGRVNVFATKLKSGPFFTNWIAVPKARGKGFLQISGSRLSLADIRKVVQAVHWGE